MCLKGTEMSTLIRDNIQNVINTYEYNIHRIEELNKLSTDLTHEIEWSNCSASEGYKLYKEYQNVLRERRECKNENDSLRPLYNFLEPKKKILDQLSQCIGECRKNDEVIGRRQYRPRVKNEIRSRVNKVMKEVVNF